MADKSVLIMPGEVTGAQAQMMRNALSRGSGRRSNGTGGRRKRRRTRSNGMRAKSASRSRSRRTTRSGAARLVKGSAAAKRYMARLRRMRRK